MRDRSRKGFAELDGLPGLSSAKRRALKHLNETQFIVACQLLSDNHDAGCDPKGEFMSYFVRNSNGMIQASGAGCYEGHHGNRLIQRTKACSGLPIH